MKNLPKLQIRVETVRRGKSEEEKEKERIDILMKEMGTYSETNKSLTQEERGLVLELLKTMCGTDRVWYNDTEGLFYYYEREFLRDTNKVVPKNFMDNVYQEAYKIIRKQQTIDYWNEMYGSAVSYFFNDVYVDENGPYRQKNFLSKKVYLTRYELDEINNRYEELMSKD